MSSQNNSAELDVSGLLAKKVVSPLHQSVISPRRIKQISHHLIDLIPQDSNLIGLDVGCGTGEIAREIEKSRPQIKMQGVEVLVRDDSVIDVIHFDGKEIPFPDKSFDFTTLVDVLHHTESPEALLKECARVSRNFILIKDHRCESIWDRSRLTLMDWVGNRGHDVNLPYNYLSKTAWDDLYKQSNLICVFSQFKLDLYPQPFSWIFDDKLHFVTKLTF